MALLFSFAVAIDKFVIGRVVTAIDYPSIHFRSCSLSRLSSRSLQSSGVSHATKGVPLSSFSMAVLFWQHSVTRGCTAPRECAIGRSYRFAENNASVPHVATTLSSEEALVAPIDTIVSIDTIVQ
jgi:hypothetical protein